ncbi:PB1 domain-containing protein [Caenorhabditis elegans]|uniref:PB1 domain-containing protein n=1 Tax=Caenorhabditis elegans TaxID=6239 RepID=Q56VZ5_CAEEL|nr:PB1 domain-containing protein [Caenorhabditis elegans]CAI79267.2 PB1 domain-containing protein [Caenorhabditis elegans]|eukprot:NP_001024965.2 Uncharacterized protein CELE_Y66C5A.2 [Caenorhabditis elegans]
MNTFSNKDRFHINLDKRLQEGDFSNFTHNIFDLLTRIEKNTKLSDRHLNIRYDEDGWEASLGLTSNEAVITACSKYWKEVDQSV